MYNVVIADDSDIDRLMVERLLGDRGFCCIAAENGQQALEKLHEWQVDLVLTDLVMPKMDGLALVRAVRQQHPRLPVIVITGEGSEETAAEALNTGAAGYIPKEQLADLLLPTVHRVLDILDDEKETGLLHHGTRTLHYELVIGNDTEKLSALVDFIDQLLIHVSPLDRIERLRISIAVDQALNNALYRGNLEIDSEHKFSLSQRSSSGSYSELLDSRLHNPPYSERKLQIVIDIKASRFAMRIVDGGPGFDWSQFGGWEHPNSRGIILMRAFMDRVEYNEAGNDVQMYYLFHRDKDGNPIAEGTTTPKPEKRPSTTRRLGQFLCLNTQETFSFKEHKSVIGTRSECHLRLSVSQTVAPLHCMVLAEPNSWTLVQISPQFHTLLNMQPVEGRVQLKKGDIISIGGREFEFQLSDQK